MIKCKWLIPILFLNAVFVSSSPLDWKTFSNGKISRLCTSKEVYQFSSDSRTVFPLVLDQTRTVGAISDVIQYENELDFSTEAGIYQLDISTQSIERIPFPNDSNRIGKIASDMDYLWIATKDSLYRFDKLGREWMSYILPEKADILALQSDGTNVECISKGKVFSFAVNTEKWNSYSNENDFNDSVSLYPGLKSQIAVYGKKYYIYKSDAHAWEKYDCGSPISDFLADDTVMFYGAGGRLMRMSNGVTRNIDIPNNGNIYALTRSSDTLYIALKRGIMKYDLKNSGISFLEYSSQMLNDTPEKIFVNGYFTIIVYEKAFAVYNGESNVWNIIGRTQKKSLTKVSWGESGPLIQYKPGFFTNAQGYVESKTQLRSSGYFYDTTEMRDSKGRIIHDSLYNPVVKVDSTPLLKFTNPDLIADVNIHSTDPKGRILDVTFDNSDLSIPAKKYINYRGTKSDILNSVRGGTCQTDILQSQLYTPVQYEGGQAIVESKSRVEGYDRKTARIGGGGGFITTKSQWKVLHYRADGIYHLSNKSGSISIDTLTDSTEFSDTAVVKKIKDTTQILPGSLRVYVDGNLLDSTYYTFFTTTAVLKIDRAAPIDPVSLITVSYKVESIPENGVEQVEFKPSHNFGKIYYGTATVSPLNWLSARVGAEAVDRDSLRPVVNAALPIELRKSKPDLLVKLTPEFSMNTKNKSKAGAIDFQSRMGKKLGLTFSGLVADSDFTAADTFTRGYGKIKNQYNAGVSYDIMQQIPLSYSQHQYTGASGIEKSYAAHTGAHFARLPFLDLDASRTVLENRGSDTSRAFDSLFHVKDRISLRLYETSSPYLEHILRSKKISYELTYAEYRYQDFGIDDFKNGRRTDLLLTYIPIQPVSIVGRGTYINGEQGNGMSSTFDPSIEVLTYDFPKGVDIYSLYKTTVAKYSIYDSTTDEIDRELGLTLNPGRWYKNLRWFTLKGSVNEAVSCIFTTSNPLKSDILSGHENVNSSTMTKTLELNFYPNETSFFRNKNQWSQTDSLKKFVTTNDLQVNFNTRNSWISSVTYNSDYTYYKVSGYTNYTYKLTSWFQLKPEIKGDFQTDSVGNKTSYGPQLTTSISTEKWYFLKNLFNDQIISLTWNRNNGRTATRPDVSYSFRLDLIILPDIKLSNQEIITYNNGSFDNFTGNLVATVIF